VHATWAEDGSRETDSTRVVVVPGSPPVISLSSAFRGRCNPSDKLAVMGVATEDGVDAQGTGAAFAWTSLVWDGAAFVAVPEPLATSTGLAGPNLVVLAGQLAAGGAYRFRLAVRTAGGEAGGSEIEFSVNEPPAGGALACVPGVGMAVRDTFRLASPGWVDDDAPLTYRFSVVTNASQGADGGRTSYLTDFGPEATQAVLPAGEAADGFVIELAVEVSDNMGAAATASVLATVRPFRIARASNGPGRPGAVNRP
jgi:hypothetical protein